MTSNTSTLGRKESHAVRESVIVYWAVMLDVSVTYAYGSGVYLDQFLGDIALMNEDVKMARQQHWLHQASDVEFTTVMPHVDAINPPNVNSAEHQLSRRRHSSR